MNCSPFVLAGALAFVPWAGLIIIATQAADGPPVLDVESTCRSPGRTQVQVQANQQDSQDGCLRSERGAHDEVKKRWSEFPASAKSQCAQQFKAGGYPSYVELVTCLELASGTGQTAGGSSAGTDVGGGATPGRKEGSALTKEPSPAQRTDPIKVLEGK